MTATATRSATIGDEIAAAVPRLEAAGVAQARRDARVLMAHVLGVDSAVVLGHPERHASAAQRRRFQSFVERRAAREPVSRIIGEREFWGLPMAVSPATLDPRPDSETLVEAVLAEIDDRHAPHALLDLGTGTGCLLLALLSELPHATGLGLDCCEDAVATARRNAVNLGVSDRSAFHCGDWADGIDGTYDIVVGNPPYVRDGEVDQLAPEVARYDPRAALAGGPDGLSAYRTLVPAIRDVLAAGGLAAVELGAGQAAAVADIATAGGLAPLRRVRDLSGVERCLLLREVNPRQRVNNTRKKVVGKAGQPDYLDGRERKLQRPDSDAPRPPVMCPW